jgi:hypothetical protein
MSCLSLSLSRSLSLSSSLPLLCIVLTCFLLLRLISGPPIYHWSSSFDFCSALLVWRHFSTMRCCRRYSDFNFVGSLACMVALPLICSFCSLSPSNSRLFSLVSHSFQWPLFLALSLNDWLVCFFCFRSTWLVTELIAGAVLRRFVSQEFSKGDAI